MTKPTVFISYSHKDESWKDRLVTHLGALQGQGLLDLWHDRRISTGEDWRQEIRAAMDAASVAVLLVSANFLTSAFILSEEVPRLLQRRDEEGLHIFPVVVRPCTWKQVEWLANMQVRPKDGRPLSSGDEHQIDVELTAIAEEIGTLHAQMAQKLAGTEIGADFQNELYLVKIGRETWLVQDGVRRKVPGGPTHRALRRKGIYLRPDGEAQGYPEGEPIKDIEPQVRRDEKGHFYLVTHELTIGDKPICDGTRMEIDEQVANYLMDGAEPLRITPGELASPGLPQLQADTADRMRNEPFQFIKGQDGGFTFLLKHPFIRWIPSSEIKRKLADRLEISSHVNKRSDEELDSLYILGPSIASQPPDHGIRNLLKWSRSSSITIPETIRSDSQSAFYALILGIGDYRYLRKLSRTTVDATDLRDLLCRNGYSAANTVLLLNEHATKAAINDKLDWLARRAGAGDTVLLFFSGHGAQRIGGFEPGEYLCPVEADWYNLSATTISNEELTTALQAIRADRIVIFLDACHSGGVGEPKDASVQIKTGLSETSFEKLSEGRGRAVIASCRPDEVSWELTDMRNSLFTHYLLEGLRGQAAGSDGAVGILDLFKYVSEQVPRYEPEQHPVFKGEIEANFAIAVVSGSEVMQQATPSPASLPVGSVTTPAGLIVNPGFEEGFVGWSEDPAQFEYGGQSVAETTQAHSGRQSRKLFLCWGGSHIEQNINLSEPLPVGTRIVLSALVKMPHPGSQSNKWFTLKLVATGPDGQEKIKSFDQSDALPSWTKLSTAPLATEFPVTKLGIHAMTILGDGSYRGFDRPVWVDDFELHIQ